MKVLSAPSTLHVFFPPDNMPLRVISLALGICTSFAAVARGEPAPRVAAESKDGPKQAGELFEKHVRPMFVEHCHKCHGAKKQQAGLRLDSREAILAGSDSGPVLVPGDPQASLLVRAVAHTDEPRMPPKKKLPERTAAALAAWVKLGAPWPTRGATRPADAADAWKSHWAFQPMTDPTPPEVRNTKWPKTPIDRFILSKLEQHGLEPSESADRRTLLRRATFDLSGLPPTAEDVEAFLADRSPQAFEKVVDRLLDSPRYGERWGRLWLDVARYADTKGYVFFEDKKFPWAYTYRDYVIRALNEDLPYDRFVLEQLAADQLDLGDDKRPLAAMGFLTLGDRFMNNQHDILDDRIDVTTRGLLGLTVTCARCHDHKYDPIPQNDYYSLYGVFRSAYEPTVPPLFQPPPAGEEYKKFTAELAKREGKLSAFIETTRKELAESARRRVTEYLQAVYAQRNQPRTDKFMLLVPKGDLHPTMILRWQVYLEKADKQNDPVWTAWHALMKIPEDHFSAAAAETLNRLAAGADDQPAIHPLVLEALQERPLASMRQVAERYGELLLGVHRRWQALCEQAQAAGEPTPTAMDDSGEESLRQVFYGPGTPPMLPELFGWGFLTLLPDRPSQDVFKKLLKEVETWSTTGPAAPARAMVLVDHKQAFEPHVFVRGNPNRKGNAVPRQFLAALSRNRRPFQHGSGRLELARAIVDPQNPLTARVLVNRVWHHHFGQGLVRTTSDFGLRSDPPSHPELLDHLATRFVRDGWSLKKLHRRTMLSAAYRQASNRRDAAYKTDPVNRLLWKMNRRRIDFETLRDSLLAASGNLDLTLGGPPVELTRAKFVSRRTVYGLIDRMNLPGLFRTFDFPSPTAHSGRRTETTVPPQSLYLMNNDFVLECARRLLQRADVAPIQSDEGKISRIYRILFARIPTAEELELAQSFLDSQAPAKRWTELVHALMMTNEFAFVD